MQRMAGRRNWWSMLTSGAMIVAVRGDSVTFSEAVRQATPGICNLFVMLGGRPGVASALAGVV